MLFIYSAKAGKPELMYSLYEYSGPGFDNNQFIDYFIERCGIIMSDVNFKIDFLTEQESVEGRILETIAGNAGLIIASKEFYNDILISTYVVSGSTAITDLIGGYLLHKTLLSLNSPGIEAFCPRVSVREFKGKVEPPEEELIDEIRHAYLQSRNNITKS